jgi:arabinofuranosyltransferase
MTGRFYSVIFLVSIICIFTMVEFKNWKTSVFLSVILIGYSLSIAHSPLNFFRATVIESNPVYPRYPNQNGISDEKGYYFQYTGLPVLDLQNPTFTGFSFVNRGIRLLNSVIEGTNQGQAEIMDSVGFSAFIVRNNLYIVDLLGLGDPLIARIPCLVSDNPRIGHYERAVPEGYLHTRNYGISNEIQNEDLNFYFDKLMIVTMGNLFSPERLKEIYYFNTGFYDGYIDRYCSSID